MASVAVEEESSIGMKYYTQHPPDMFDDKWHIPAAPQITLYSVETQTESDDFE
jgi:hypothetical protein